MKQEQKEIEELNKKLKDLKEKNDQDDEIQDLEEELIQKKGEYITIQDEINLLLKNLSSIKKITEKDFLQDLRNIKEMEKKLNDEKSQLIILQSQMKV